MDVGTIPAALVERVEVLTGGASAIYGADAVSGVVNFIMKKEFDGFESRAQFDINDQGDGSRYFVSAATGTQFADGKGSAAVAVEYRNQSRFACGDASFCEDFGVWFNGDNPNPDGPPLTYGPHYTFAISSAMGRFGVDFDGDGVADSEAPEGFFLDTDGDGANDMGQTDLGGFGFGDWVVRDSGMDVFETGDRSGFANQFGGDGAAAGPFNFQDLIPEQDSVVANGLVRYRLNDYANFFVDSKFVYTKTELLGDYTAFNDALTISLENPYIPTELRQAIDSAIEQNPALVDTTNIYMYRDFLDLGESYTENERQTMRLVTGFDGDLPGGVSYEASFNYGRTSQETLSLNNRIEDRFFAAIDVVTDANGNPICRAEFDPAAPPPPTSPFPPIEEGFRTFSPGDGTCKPINLFGLNKNSQEAIDFVTADTVDTSTIEQHVVNVSVTGNSEELGVKLPAGGIGYALGAEYRREFSRFRPDALSQTGITWDGTTVAGLQGDYDVREAFGEISIPIVRKVTGAEDVTVDAALRAADYSTIGSSVSWKVRGSWTPTFDIRVRSSYSVAVRAPNVGELFQAETAAFFRPDDPCDMNLINALDGEARDIRVANCAADDLPADFVDPLTARFAGVTSGNENLDPEEAETITVGGVITPRWVPGLVLSVDYFDIELKDAIDTVSSQDIVNNCYNNPGGIDNEFCDLFTRNRDPDSPTYLGFNFLRSTQINIGQKSVRGFDFEATYPLELSRLGADEFGTLNFRMYGTRLSRLEDTPDQNNPEFKNPELREVRRPRWILNPSLRWNWNQLMVNYGMSYMGKQVLDRAEVEELNEFYGDRGETGRTFIHDVSANYQVLPELSVYGGVRNIAGSDPFKTSTSFPVSPMGRVFFMGLDSRF